MRKVKTNVRERYMTAARIYSVVYLQSLNWNNLTVEYVRFWLLDNQRDNQVYFA
jgi:hypothetical protein